MLRIRRSEIPPADRGPGLPADPRGPPDTPGPGRPTGPGTPRVEPHENTLGCDNNYCGAAYESLPSAIPAHNGADPGLDRTWRVFVGCVYPMLIVFNGAGRLLESL